MTRPPLPLDRIHRWKLQQRRQAERRLQQLLNSKRKIELEYADIRGEVQTLARETEVSLLADVEANARYSRRLESKLNEIAERLQQAHVVWLEARGQYETLTRELDVLESVRDRQLERLSQEEQKKWYSWLDDIEMSRWEPEHESESH